MKTITTEQLGKYEVKQRTRKSAIDFDETVKAMSEGLVVFEATSTNDTRKETLSRQTLYKLMRALVSKGNVYYSWRLDKNGFDVLILSFAQFDGSKQYTH